MPKLTRKPPKLRHHKATGRAFVSLSGRDYYCGKWDSPQATAEYNRLVGLWLMNDRQMPDRDAGLTVAELAARFWQHAQAYYVKPDGTPTTEQGSFGDAMRALRQFDDTMAAGFGPKELRQARQWMIDQGWCRTNINRQVARVKAIFKWGVGQSLIVPAVLQALQCVEPLKRGRSSARESEPVRPVPESFIQAVKPFVSDQVWAMIQLQLLSGARAGELTKLRAVDIDTTGDLWEARLGDHKTAHHGHRRTIFFLPEAQPVIRSFMAGRPVDAFLFSPSEAMAELHAKQRAERKTRVQPSQIRRSEQACIRAARGKRRRAPGDRYDTASYRRAIQRACDMADAEAKKKLAKEGKQVTEDRIIPRWHPHQLRHNAGTEFRRKYGIENAQLLLGHALGSNITEVYSEASVAKLRELIAKAG